MVTPRPLRWTRKALDDLDEELGYIAQFNPGAAHRLRVSILKALGLARSFPRTPRMVPEEGDPAVREILRAPLRIIFEVHPRELRILAVRRMERAPLEPGDL